MLVLQSINFASRIFVLLVFVLPACAGNSGKYQRVTGERGKAPSRVALGNSLFDELGREWIASSYFDRGMKYKNSRLEVVSLSRLLDKYGAGEGVDAILLNCVDDYQGIVSVDDVRRYDLQLAVKIELAQGADRPDWLEPLLIVVPDNMSPPFLERFMTANINEIRFVRLTDYYAPLDRAALRGTSAEQGLKVFKDNCLFCHSINDVGGNKGGSLLAKFNFKLDQEKRRFRDTFLIKHGQVNANKQNTKQFLTDGQLTDLSEFLSAMATV